ncbi:valine--tRNA ligase [Scleromatobacter humisilvae]|uniref:Valine--tRNA ligase n=1 Tax=Scleromatobacter humisilvae TaxID=2897159 RepID=A0A9X1YKK2_9BURK|nr:valine--tRNA ligase [Scleromatobacter humisilvae]MCK9688284.1 valine--tRNA ligase [Scleromatobacter humisilvae]
MSELAKSFEPAAIEARWAPLWEQAGVYEPTLDPAKQSFSIQLPPPNVTGTLHMGHAFNQTIMDSLTRYHRMRGFNTLWVPGTDHAGIATQIVVERQLQDLGLSRQELGRKNFVARVWDWKQESGSTITRQMRRMGDSVSWKHEYFTMDEGLSKTVTETFVRLFDEGLIYRGRRLVHWDPVLKSAVSDLEVDSKEEDGFLWFVRYPLADGSGDLTVATTRPETMLGDVALMVNPGDERYTALVGKEVILPLVGKKIPVIADDYVDREFGTGVVKVTPAHDANDYAVGLRHDLPIIGVLALDATINDNAPEPYRGLDRFVARKRIVSDLDAQGFLVETRKHKLMVPRCERTGQVIEPMLTNQWYVAMTKPGADGTSIAGKAIKAVASGEVKFYPEQWVNTYNHWMNDIQDWCISRQLWWGHQIPAWYADDGQIFVARSDEEAAQKAAAAGYTGKLVRDEDVLDTWYSSALVPFSTLGWPGKTLEQDLFLPSSVLVTGYDIIFFWVARMIMMTTHFTGKVPFRDVYIHGLVRDAQGQKMSKSEGNVLDPVDLIDGIALDPLLDKRVIGLRRPETAPRVRENTKKEFPEGIPAYGADALRFTFAALATLGRNIAFDSKRCEGYRNFCNKLWNATKFVLMNCEGQDCGLLEGDKTECPPGYNSFSQADRWITSELQRAEAAVAQGFAEYRLDNVANAIYQFVWTEYCDWYLEIAKAQLAEAKAAGNEAAARGTRRTLVRTLETVLRLMHPVTPFVTAELWETVAPIAGRAPAAGQTIATAPYPVAQLERVDEAACAWVARFKALVLATRSVAKQMNIAENKRPPLLTHGDAEFVAQAAPLLKALAKVGDVQVIADEAAFVDATKLLPVAVEGNVRLALHVEIDVGAERERLDKEIARLDNEIEKAHKQLGNENFVSRAKPEVVEQMRTRLAGFVETVARMKAQREQLGG